MMRGRALGATREENSEGGGEACSVDDEVCSSDGRGDGEGACSGNRRGDGEGEGLGYDRRGER
jgi:hypothetical protein